MMGNIAGRLGYLDFSLPDGKGKLVRTGLKLDAAKNQGSLQSEDSFGGEIESASCQSNKLGSSDAETRWIARDPVKR